VKRIKTRILPGWDGIELAVPVHFSEVDSMKLVWHGHYLRYCESAREVYCRERGLSYQQMEDGNCVAPVVRAQLEYLAPARMGQTVSVRCARIPGTEPMLNLFYEIRGPAVDGRARLLCIAETVQVFIDLAGQPYLTPPPPVAALFAAIAARERGLGGAGATP
jgi:acyl-CoA thioester hydrolase